MCRSLNYATYASPMPLICNCIANTRTRMSKGRTSSRCISSSIRSTTVSKTTSTSLPSGRVQLGGIANSMARVVTTWADMPENDSRSPSERDYVQSLSGALASFGRIAREAIGKSNELGDAVSADIFTEISRGVEKWLWMVGAHLQSQR